MMETERADGQIVVGWREWVLLPELGVPLIKAKIDTGARTSALHTFQIEEIQRDGGRFVRFSLHPQQRRNDSVVVCEARVADYRSVRDSGGHSEDRYVIRTQLQLGDVVRVAEVTLTNREDMQYRMLVGRSALDGVLVRPTASYALGTRAQLQQRTKEGK